MELLDLLASNDESSIQLGLTILEGMPEEFPKVERMLLARLGEAEAFLLNLEEELTEALSKGPNEVPAEERKMFRELLSQQWEDKQLLPLANFALELSQNPAYQVVFDRSWYLGDTLARLSKRLGLNSLRKAQQLYALGRKALHQAGPELSRARYRIYHYINLCSDVLRDPRETIFWYEQLSLHRPDAVYYNNMAACYLELGEDNRALTLFDEAIRLTPGLSLYWRNKANTLGDLGRFEEAEELFEELLLKFPQDDDLPNSLGNFYWLKKGDYEAARDAYLNGLKRFPKDTMMLGNLAELYADVLDDVDQAKIYYEKFLSFAKKEDLELYRCTTLCAFFARIEDWEQALNFYKRTFNLQRRLKIKRDEGLRDDQWEAFVEARNSLKAKGLITR